MCRSRFVFFPPGNFTGLDWPLQDLTELSAAVAAWSSSKITTAKKGANYRELVRIGESGSNRRFFLTQARPNDFSKIVGREFCTRNVEFRHCICIQHIRELRK